MAIAVDYDGPFGVTTGSYFRIEVMTTRRIFNQTYKHVTHLSVIGYLSEQSGLDQKQGIANLEYDAPYCADYPAAYTWLKTLTEFSGAIDVQEDM